MSPAGDALTMLPPMVPRFWIWTAPMVAAASASTGRCAATSGGATQVGLGAQRADDERTRPTRDAPQLVEPPDVQQALGWLADLARDADHQVRATRDGCPVAARKQARTPRPATAGS